MNSCVECNSMFSLADPWLLGSSCGRVFDVVVSSDSPRFGLGRRVLAPPKLFPSSTSSCKLRVFCLLAASLVSSRALSNEQTFDALPAAPHSNGCFRLGRGGLCHHRADSDHWPIFLTGGHWVCLVSSCCPAAGLSVSAAGSRATSGGLRLTSSILPPT